MRPRPPRRRALAVALVALAAMAVPALRAGDEEEDKNAKLAKAYDKATKDSTLHKGLFDLRSKEGKLYLDLEKGDLGKSFLLLTTIARGISAGNLLGGMMSWQDEWVLEFRRDEDRVQVVRKNIRFKADAKTPMGEAVKLSFSDSVIASLDLEGQSKSGRMLVELDSLLLSDMTDLGSMVEGAMGGGYSFNRRLSTWGSVKAFPKNLELQANLTYSGGDLDRSDTVPDSRFVSFTAHYSLVSLPKDGYKPRKADDRLGHFLVAHKDYSEDSIDGPFQRYIWRWHLEKADPKAERSTVKEPIVFYLEKTIPYEWRPYIRQGVLEWNKAFEKIGLVDAIEVRLQGPDATWDPEDVRYNTIRWITSPYSFAIGPSHVDPTTGQILDSDILIDASWIRLWQREVQLEDLGPAGGAAGWWTREDPGADLDPLSRRMAQRSRGRAHLPSFFEGFRHQFQLGAMHLLSPASAEGKKKGDADEQGIPTWFIGAALKDLVMHEVGHTLGLRHNFKASSIRSLEAMQDRSLTEKEGLVGSVMDYLATNIVPEGQKQGEYHPSTIGPYDYWVIDYAYGSHKDDKALSAVASKATTAELAFASDEDVHPIANRNVDPLVGLWDLGGEPLEFARQRRKVVMDLWGKILDRVVREGENYTRARRAVGTLAWELRNGAMVAARYVGGQYHHRDHKGDPGERPSFVLVPAKKQRDALAFLGEGVFSDSTWQLSPDLLNRLAPSHWWHWGSDIFGERLDYPFHSVVQRVQISTLVRLLSPRVLERILDAERKVKPDEDLLTVPELFATLTKMIFSELDGKADGEYSSRKPMISALRRNLQRSYVAIVSHLALRLSGVSSRGDARILARAELRKLHGKLAEVLKDSGSKLDAYSAGHLEDLHARIGQALDAKRQLSGF